MSELIQLGAQRPKAPAPEELNLRFSDAAIQELENLRPHYATTKALILPTLWLAQREYGGYLSPAAIAEVAHRLDRSYAEIEGVATFYSMYTTAHEPGTHMIEVCTCLSCYMCGAYRMVEHLEERLGIRLGETTADGRITMHEVECLDACDRAPMLQVGDEYIGPVDEGILDQLIDRLQNDPNSTVVKLADEIVQVHLRDTERVNK